MQAALFDGGARLQPSLLETGLEAGLPPIGTFPREPEPDAGVTPDMAVATTAEAIAAGDDAAMRRALA